MNIFDLPSKHPRCPALKANGAGTAPSPAADARAGTSTATLTPADVAKAVWWASKERLARSTRRSSWKVSGHVIGVYVGRGGAW